jgi:hypothetical protein
MPTCELVALVSPEYSDNLPNILPTEAKLTQKLQGNASFFRVYMAIKNRKSSTDESTAYQSYTAWNFQMIICGVVTVNGLDKSPLILESDFSNAPTPQCSMLP